MELLGQGLKKQPPRKFHTIKIACADSDEQNYPLNLSFFQDVPDYNVSLQQLEDFSLARLKLFRTIERINMTMPPAEKYSSKWRSAIRRDLKKQNLHEFEILEGGCNLPAEVTAEDKMNARKFDHISHYILRIPFCRTDDLRRWLISMELDFFHFKFHVDKDDLRKFMSHNNFSFKDMSPELKEKFESKLQSASYHITPNSVDFFEVLFIHALELVRTRKVYLANGIAYVPYTDTVSMFCAEFRKILSQELVLMSKYLHKVGDDVRMVSLLNEFEKQYTGTEYVAKNGQENGITADMLPAISKKSFPLCMKSLYDVVTKDHHLKHWGRLQLGLFLKGAGVPLEESVRFWRTNFNKNPGMDSGRFDKVYLYNIRHMYGQEGKRTDYTPYPCMKVIMSNVGPGDQHGCPFRHSDAKPLREKFVEANIPANGIAEILELVGKQQYQVACQKYFEWTHDLNTVEGGVNHPNQYFEESQNVLSGRNVVKKQGAVPTSKTNVYAENPVHSPSNPVESSTQETEDMVVDPEELEDRELFKLINENK